MLPNWFESQSPNFVRHVPSVELRALQIGAFTGDATSWLLQNREVEIIHDVDIWTRNNELQHENIDFSSAEALWDYRFGSNPRVKKFKMSSNEYFLQCRSTFNFIYIDGDHGSLQTALDGLNAWRILDPGGVMAFDDYGWSLNPDEFLRPKRGIDAFLSIVRDKCTIMEIAYQLWIQKQ